LGADMVATGHYCRKDSFTDADGNTVYRLLAGTDPNKDQSYFLCQLNQEQLSKALFPIGEICKPEVRRIAREAGLPTAEKKDSQGICFVGKVDLPVFLQQKLKPREGRVVEIFRDFYESQPARETLESQEEPYIYKPEDGKVIGRHDGVQFYTIGQRKGLDIGGHKESIFIISMDLEENVIYVGEGQSHPGLYRKALRVRPQEVHWIRPDLALAPGGEMPCKVRIRYRQPLQDATLVCRENGLYIAFDEPQRGITPGQFAAWYSAEGELLGSGPIER
ncbi:MAG: tRNA 2-thiouridine(34) synthase MnmA, partial [Bacteroidales bacterium]|nr:tRNA 2-thiouridine(34) synthase MnmA [Bacteroidales bacterium]